MVALDNSNHLWYHMGVSGQDESEYESLTMQHQAESITIGAKPSSALTTPDPASGCCSEGFPYEGFSRMRAQRAPTPLPPILC